MTPTNGLNGLNWRGIRAIVRKDLKVVLKNRMTMLPIIILPLIFLVVLPVGAVFLFSSPAAMKDMTEDSEIFMQNLPPSISVEIERFDSETQKWIYLITMYQFAPMFLILPLMISSVIGADSFAGELERKTMEGLIYTPLTDFELFIGKMLSAWLPALAVSVVGGLLYCLVVDIAAYPQMQAIFLPNLMWIVLVVWLCPAAAGLGLAAIILVSSRVKTMQEAYQTGGMVVLPVVALMIAQFAGVIYFDVLTVILIGLVVWLIDIGMIWIGAKTFQRGELIARL